MKIKIARLTLLLLLPITVVAQQQAETKSRKIEKADSIQLSKTWTQFLTALEQRDNSTIKKMSLNRISCDLCKDNDPNYSDVFVAIDTFINQTNRIFLTSPLYKAIRKRGVGYSILNIADFKPGNIPKSTSKDLRLFEIWVITYVADEWAKGHEGQSHAFQFIKTEHGFKFYGLRSVP
jgi:hypothetical protein